jgi:hypothetical protein
MAAGSVAFLLGLSITSDVLSSPALRFAISLADAANSAMRWSASAAPDGAARIRCDALAMRSSLGGSCA